MRALARAARGGLALLSALALAACSAAPIPGAFTEEELRARCERDGGWWKAHDRPPRCEAILGTF